MRIVCRILGAAVAAALTAVPATADAKRMSDAAIRQRIIRASIGAYPRSCPCPYSRDRIGHRCGGRSAYSRPGGYEPKCYAADVSNAEVRAWRVER